MNTRIKDNRIKALIYLLLFFVLIARSIFSPDAAEAVEPVQRFPELIVPVNSKVIPIKFFDPCF